MRLLFNSGRFRRHRCCAVNRYVIFICSPVDVGNIRLVVITKRDSWLAPFDKQPRTGHRMAVCLMATCPSRSVLTLPWASLWLPKKKYRDAPARCPVPEGQMRYTYQHARVELWLHLHCRCLVCVGRGSWHHAEG